MTKRDRTTEKTSPVEQEEPHRGPYADWRGPYEEMAEPPVVVTPLTIVTPEAGATVPAVHNIVGTGGTPGGTVTLAYGEGETVVAETAAAATGSWAFTGDQPAAVGPQTWTVRDGDRTASVSVIVEEDVSRKRR